MAQPYGTKVIAAVEARLGKLNYYAQSPHSPKGRLYDDLQKRIKHTRDLIAAQAPKRDVYEMIYSILVGFSGLGTRWGSAKSVDV